MKYATVFLLATIMAVNSNAARKELPLNEGWRFHKGIAEVTAPMDDWETVSLPHTWNIVDGQSSGENRLDDNGHAIKGTMENTAVVNPYTRFGYYRGSGWYGHNITPEADWKDKRVFVRFEGAGQVAKVFINGRLLGEHRGAFTAFCYELTPYIVADVANELRVEVDNMHREDLPPLSGDFNINGGLYRQAKIIVTDKICITPCDYASPGVYLTPGINPDGSATVNVKTVVDNGFRTSMSNEPYVEPAELTVKASIINADGVVVASGHEEVSIDADTRRCLSQNLAIVSPHLWNGRFDPYLYTALVEIARDGKVIDAVRQPLGIRDFFIDQTKGFILNGKPYSIHGVGRHQDKRDKAWALSHEDNLADYEIMKDLGATAIRFAHYPQSESMHAIADLEGFMVWDEIPLVNEIRLDNGSKENVRVMLREMVRQLYNHPSVAWWGIYNEIENIYTPPSEDFLAELRDEIRTFDPSCRMIVGASDHGNRAHNLIPECTCFNNYPGWYFGNFPKEEGYTGNHDQFAKWITDRSREVGGRIAISEYGAGGDYTQHTEGKPTKPNPAHGGPFQPEEWLAYVHEQDLRIMKDNPDLWGTFLWAMFDFSSCMRKEGSVSSVNTKGIVSHDRKVRKDPFFLYKANWNPEPMVYIASRRLTERKSRNTDIKVYANCDNVTLEVNGKKVKTTIPDNVKVCLFENIKLNKGENTIRVYGTKGGQKVEDLCYWTVKGK